MGDYIPKIGEKCLMKFYVSPWKEGIINYISDNSVVFIDENKNEFAWELKNISFKPIKSDRDLAIEDICEYTGLNVDLEMIGALYDAGYRKVKPISRREFEKELCSYPTLGQVFDILVNRGVIVEQEQ